MILQKFDPGELKVVKEEINVHTNLPVITYSFPVSMAEAVKALYRREPYWQINCLDYHTFVPACNPDTVARATAREAREFTPTGGKDIFGIDWEYVPIVGGSMVRPGKPFLSDANEWYDKVVWPDISKWDWESCAKANNGTYLTDDTCDSAWMLNGWFERLISMMDFEGAIMALFDDDQQDAVKALFDKLTDLYIDIVDKYLEYFPQLDGFTVHDDWGSQKNTFFSPELAAEMIVPYMRRLTDHIHSKGRFADLHSCGQNFQQVPNMIAAGWDSWTPQPMNDTEKIYELYGDKIIIAVMPEQFNPDELSEKEIRAKAREFVDRYSKPGKPCLLSAYGMSVAVRPYLDEMYEYSRKKFSGEI